MLQNGVDRELKVRLNERKYVRKSLLQLLFLLIWGSTQVRSYAPLQRPDIAFAITKMAQFAANPSQEHLDKALYICRYLVGTQNYALVFKGKSNEGLYVHTDSDCHNRHLYPTHMTCF